LCPRRRAATPQTTPNQTIGRIGRVLRRPATTFLPQIKSRNSRYAFELARHARRGRSGHARCLLKYKTHTEAKNDLFNRWTLRSLDDRAVHIAG
jgi:hypothetical protein